MLSNYFHRDRYYHDIIHISDLFQQLPQMIKVYRDQITHLDALIHAILWHDAVYVPGRMDNEEQSAIAGAEHYNGTPNELIAFHNIVMASRHTGEPLATIEEQIMADIDLSGLAKDFDHFINITFLIYHEYACSMDAFRAGRIAWAEGMLSRERIYHTDLYHKLYDGKARENLTEMIRILKDPACYDTMYG